MEDLQALTLDELIEQITMWTYGMPVRLMERVLEIGESAVPALAAALELLEEDEERDPLWLIVLLGDLRQPDAIPALLHEMRRTELDVFAVAASEGLAKIGAPAVAPLVDLTEKGTTLERLYAYAALGNIHDDRAYARLTEALRHDGELADVVAMALGEQRRAESIPLLYDAYTRCHPWQRPEFEAALRSLHESEPPDARSVPDWRLRYRRLPDLDGAIELNWAGILSVVHQNETKLREREVGPVRALDEILGDPEPDDEETCEDCGALLEYPTGLPACPATAVATAVYQGNLLTDAREDGIDDLFDWLDELEADELDLHDEGEPDTKKDRDRWEEEIDELQSARETCRWLIEHGARTVGEAKAMLLAELPRLAERYGDPEGLLQPLRPARAPGPKIGRNDPCPCGSGRKYKRCCLDKA